MADIDGADKVVSHSLLQAGRPTRSKDMGLNDRMESSEDDKEYKLKLDKSNIKQCFPTEAAEDDLGKKYIPIFKTHKMGAR